MRAAAFFYINAIDLFGARSSLLRKRVFVINVRSLNNNFSRNISKNKKSVCVCLLPLHHFTASVRI